MKRMIILGAGATYGASTCNPFIKPPLLKDLPEIVESEVITLNRSKDGPEFGRTFKELLRLTNTDNNVEIFFTVIHILGLISKQIDPTIIFIKQDEIDKLIKGNTLSQIFINKDIENIARIILDYYSKRNPIFIYPLNLQTLFQSSLHDYMYHALTNCFCIYHESLFKDLNENDTVVNFNYDEIGDFTLFTLNKLSEKSFINLGFENISFPDVISQSCNPVKYIKVHGSFNWSMKIESSNPVYYDLVSQVSTNRTMGHTPFPIVLPTITKDLIYKQYPIYSSHINEFAKSLEQVELIYLVGKTFMNSDYELNKIIQKQRSKSKCKLILVDPCCRNADFVKHHEELFNAFCVEKYFFLFDYYIGKKFN